MIFIDAHVHFHDCFDQDSFLDSAYENFINQSKLMSVKNGCQSDYVLLLAEKEGDEWFHGLLTELTANRDVQWNKKKWNFIGGGSPDIVVAHKTGNTAEKIYLVAGRQLISKENIEVLQLFSNKRTEHNLSLADTINQIRKLGGVPIIPWGAGKWLGKRGEIIKKYILSNSAKPLYLGDNGGRPQLWKYPAIFTLAANEGVACLPGTDCLPLGSESDRVGSYGFMIETINDNDMNPALYVKKCLLAGDTVITPYGKLMSSLIFLKNQIALRLSK